MRGQGGKQFQKKEAKSEEEMGMKALSRFVFITTIYVAISLLKECRASSSENGADRVEGAGNSCDLPVSVTIERGGHNFEALECQNLNSVLKIAAEINKLKDEAMSGSQDFLAVNQPTGSEAALTIEQKCAGGPDQVIAMPEGSTESLEQKNYKIKYKQLQNQLVNECPVFTESQEEVPQLPEHFSILPNENRLSDDAEGFWPSQEEPCSIGATEDDEDDTLSKTCNIVLEECNARNKFYSSLENLSKDSEFLGQLSNDSKQDTTITMERMEKEPNNGTSAITNQDEEENEFGSMTIVSNPLFAFNGHYLGRMSSFHSTDGELQENVLMAPHSSLNPSFNNSTPKFIGYQVFPTCRASRTAFSVDSESGLTESSVHLRLEREKNNSSLYCSLVVLAFLLIFVLLIGLKHYL